MAARGSNEAGDESPEIREPDADESVDGRDAYEQSALDDTQSFDSGSSSRDYAPIDVDSALTRTIESEIIPRLLMAHRQSSTKASIAPREAKIIDGEIEHLVMLSINKTLSVTRHYVDSLRARGLSVETIVAEVLPAAARHVGWMWETDACTFVDVTFALSKLQQLLRHYAPSLDVELPQCGEGRRVLLSSMPGEQHTFGLTVVEEFFRRAAWDVVPQTPAAKVDLLRYVCEEWFDIVGLSASADGTLAAMASLIQEIRTASINKSVRVMIGGAAVAREPELAAGQGADAVARDPRHGIDQMEWMMRSLQQPC